MIEKFLKGSAAPATIVWIALIALLPVTSTPVVARLLGSSTVASPSIILLALFIFLWLVPALLTGHKLSQASLVLLILFCCAAGLSLIMNANAILSYKTTTPLRAQIEGIATLLIGVGFFMSTAAFTSYPDKRRLTLSVINFSGLIVLLWCFLQAYFWLRYQRYPEWLRSLQELISIGPLFRGRVTGFALEPSWLAHQLNMLYLPIWLAASATGYSSHRKFGKRFSFEMILLVLGVVTLIMTMSRAGYLAFLLMSGFIFVLLIRWLSEKVKKFVKPERQRAAGFLTSFALTVGGIVAVIGFLYVVSRVDPRMADLFKFDPDAANPILDYANALLFSSRVVYWQAGWRIFDLHPWMGVGIGLAGFHMPELLSGYATRLVEVQTLLYHSNTLLNIKSLWVRLLAETGIAGFSLFVTWLILIARQAWRLLKALDSQSRMIGLAGIFVLLALITEGFSIDSFAIPYLWVSLGLVTATSMGGQSASSR